MGHGDESNMPTTNISKEEISEGINILDVLIKAELIASKGEGKRLISQNGIAIDGEKISDPMLILNLDSFKNGEIKIKKGKKVFHKIKLV